MRSKPLNATAPSVKTDELINELHLWAGEASHRHFNRRQEMVVLKRYRTAAVQRE